MVLTKGKRIFLGLSIVLPFLFYCIYYYGMMLKNAPYKYAEFESLSIQYGERDKLVNTYNSATSQYEYLDRKDSLVKKKLQLSDADLLYLHRKAADLGFWDFPVNETGDSVTTGAKPPRYIIEYKYQRKSKKVTYDANFVGNQRLVDANQRLVKEILKVLARAEAAQEK
ncbi:hypothetical protein [Mucilaginibacter antarcticus]|uniref:Uncharacterized protein n=1 Tax=Mucilaginibacter antarcticus TaxID=1855725 RepID=A0ABW5XP74_9SPHI